MRLFACAICWITPARPSRWQAGRSRADLDTDRLLNLSLVRLLEIIGEAANRISKDVQDEHPEIPWSNIIGLRHRLIHGYSSIDLDIVWQIVTADLQPLVAALERMLGDSG